MRAKKNKLIAIQIDKESERRNIEIYDCNTLYLLNHQLQNKTVIFNTLFCIT